MSRRRDVAFYAPWAGPNLTSTEQPSGGAEVQVMQLATGLVGSGLRVGLVTYAVPGLPTERDGLEIVRQPRPAWGFAPARHIAVLATTVWTLLRLRSASTVQRSAGAETGLVALTSRLTGARFVFSSSSTRDFTLHEYGYGRITLLLYRLGIRLAHTVVVQTDEQAEQCREVFGRDSVVIRSVAGLADAPRGGAASQGFLWIGRLNDYKNPMAYVDLAEAVPEAPFTMVCVPTDDPGSVPYAEIEARAASIPNLTLLGPQSRPDVLERIAGATAIVTTSDFEGMPNTLIEGWSRGVPALSLSHDPDGLIARETLGSVAQADPLQLRDLARALWVGRDRDGELRDRCRAYVRREHHPDAIVAKWREVLRGV